MRTRTVVLATACLVLLGTGSAIAQDRSPPPWMGGRVELPQHGFAVTLPMTCAALDPKGDLVAQEEAVRQAWEDASYVSFAPPNPVRDTFAAYAGPGNTPRFQLCLIGADNGDAAGLRSSVARFHETIASSDMFARPPGYQGGGPARWGRLHNRLRAT